MTDSVTIARQLLRDLSSELEDAADRQERAEERCKRIGHCWDQGGRDCPIVEGSPCTQCYWCGLERERPL